MNKNSVENQIKIIDVEINKKAYNYLGVNLNPLLITKLYNKQHFGLMQHIKDIIKLIPLNQSLKISEINNAFLEEQYDFIIYFGYDIEDCRNSSLLDELVSQISKEYKTLIITNKLSVYEQMSSQRACVLVEFPRFLKSKFRHLIKLDHAKTFSEAEYFIDILINLFERYRPRLVLTLQDYMPYDYLVSQVGRKLGIPTITHQHGMVPYPHPGLYKYVFSDYIMVWGNASYQTLKEFIPKNKIKVVGTNKFNYLLEQPKNIKQNCITIGLNPLGERENIRIITQLLLILDESWSELKEIEKLIIKLHPALNNQQWLVLINKIIKENKIKIDYIVSSEKNYNVLYSTRILIANKSTISMEAMLAGCSIIELDYADSGIYQENRLFINIPESIVNYNNIISEIHKRLTDEDYDAYILDKQKTIIKDEIEAFSIQKEIEFIKELINKK